MYRFFRRNREKVMKYLLIFFLGVVSVGMVITLAPIPGGDTSQAQSNVLASVNGSDVTTQDLQRSIDAQFRNSPLRNNPAIIGQLAGTVLDEMILERGLLVQARKLGLEVSNQELMQALQSLPFLTVNGTFVGMERYRDVVQQQTGMTVPQFEAQLRDSTLLQKMRDVITDPIQVTPDEVRQEFLHRNEKVKIQYVVFDPSQFLKSVEVTRAALQTYFDRNKIHYKLPEERRVRYVLIDQDRVRSLVKISDAELKEYYAQHLQEYRVPERVKAAHILFKTTGKSPAEIAQIEAKAQNVLNQIQKGADFSEMAKKNSEDDGSAQKGGDLGWIVRGQTVKEFEDAAFSMQPGQVSGLIKTTYGIHIIKVFDKQNAHVQSFGEVKPSIEALLEKQKIEDKQTSLADQLERALKADPQHFDAVAQKFGSTAEETPLFKYNQPVPDLGNNEGLENLTFQLRSGEVGEPITLPKGMAVIQVAEIVPEHLPKLDEVRAQVEEDYRAQQSRALASQKAQEFAARAKTGDFKKLAQSLGLTVKASNDFTRQDNVGDLLSGAELSAAFTMNPGQSSDVVQAGANNVVFQVLSHTPAEQSTFAQQQEQIRDQLLEQKRNLAFEIYRKNLKQEMLRTGELKLNDAAMKQFLSAYTRT